MSSDNVVNLSDSIEKLKYWFSGEVIKLRRSQYERWKQAYWAIPDFDAELVSLDDFYAELPEQDKKRWFVRCSRALSKKHQQYVASETGEVTPPYKREIIKLDAKSWELYCKQMNKPWLITANPELTPEKYREWREKTRQ